MSSPMQRSLEYLRKRHYIATTVEQWVRYPDKADDLKGRARGWIAKILAPYRPSSFDPELVESLSSDLVPKIIAIKRDVWAFGDILAAGSNGIWLIQTTTRDHQAERLAKIYDIPEARTWLESGGKIAVHGWAQVGPRGVKKTWQVSITPVTLDELSAETLALQDRLFA